ncbi:hypothetical protein MHBO_004713 [Bonamia ostreae]|uniref:Uncharacterized protein n=1 Tax=Bonamia ostreae TaxID=126728 RepID=A0ABV2AUV6_9EUKA
MFSIPSAILNYWGRSLNEGNEFFEKYLEDNKENALDFNTNFVKNEIAFKDDQNFDALSSNYEKNNFKRMKRRISPATGCGSIFFDELIQNKIF